MNPAQHRIWNNEFLVKSMGTSRAYFMDLQAFGNAQGQNHGSLWIYGNLFRNDASATVRMKRFWQGYCDIASGGYELYFFNNSFDMDTEIGPSAAPARAISPSRPTTPSCARPRSTNPPPRRCGAR